MMLGPRTRSQSRLLQQASSSNSATSSNNGDPNKTVLAEIPHPNGVNKVAPKSRSNPNNALPKAERALKPVDSSSPRARSRIAAENITLSNDEFNTEANRTVLASTRQADLHSPKVDDVSKPRKNFVGAESGPSKIIPKESKPKPKRFKVNTMSSQKVGSQLQHQVSNKTPQSSDGKIVQTNPADSVIPGPAPKMVSKIENNLQNMAIATKNKKSQNNGKRTTLAAMSEQTQLLLAYDKSQCSFCSVEMKEMEGIMLDECLHVFCRECLTAAVELQEGVQIKCPVSDEFDCGGFLLEQEIRALLNPAAYQKYLDRSMILARQGIANQFQCKTPGCLVWCEFEQGNKVFYCYSCNKANCLECKAIHDGVDCAVYQDVLKLAKSSGQGTQELLEKQMQNGWEQLRGLIGNGSGNMESILQSLQNEDLFKSTRVFDCPICFCEIPVGGGIILQDCLHTFCHECLIGLVENTDEPNVKCPHIDGNYSCVNHLKPREIKALVSPEIYERYLKKSEKLAESGMANSYHCKTPDCTGWCEIDEDERARPKSFKCFICKKENCLSCNVIHAGVSCEDYKNRLVQNENDKLSEDALNKMVKSGECMRCPKCKTIVQKLVGCDWMICMACRTELCWATKGPRWGPNGKGDTSGGCKCQYTVFGKKCAPHCQNCH